MNTGKRISAEEKLAEMQKELIQQMMDDMVPYTLVSSTSQKEYRLDTLPEFPGEENIEEFSHPALKVYEDKCADFYVDDDWQETPKSILGCIVPSVTHELAATRQRILSPALNGTTTLSPKVISLGTDVSWRTSVIEPWLRGRR